MAFPRACLWLSHSFGCFLAGLFGCGRACPVKVVVLECWSLYMWSLYTTHLPRALNFQEYFFITRMQMLLLLGTVQPIFLQPGKKKKRKKSNTTWTLVAILTAKVFPGSLSNFSSLFPRTAASNLNCKWQAGDCSAALPELMLCFHVFSLINSSSASLC